MNGYNFTERVRKVLAMAREEATRLHHEYVGTEHILLGLVREGEGVASAVLENLSVDGDAVRRRVEEMVQRGPHPPRGPDLPYTSRAKKVLELAMHEAGDLKHSYVGTEHLLLALIREERGIAADVLGHFGVRIEPARAETIRLLGEPPAPPRSQVRRSAPGHSLRPARVFLRVECDDGSRFEERFDGTDDAIAWLRAFSRPSS